MMGAWINQQCPYCGKQLKSQGFTCIMRKRFCLKNPEDGGVVPLFPIINFVASTTKGKRRKCVCMWSAKIYLKFIKPRCAHAQRELIVVCLLLLCPIPCFLFTMSLYSCILGVFFCHTEASAPMVLFICIQLFLKKSCHNFLITGSNSKIPTPRSSLLQVNWTQMDFRGREKLRLGEDIILCIYTCMYILCYVYCAYVYTGGWKGYSASS